MSCWFRALLGTTLHNTCSSYAEVQPASCALPNPRDKECQRHTGYVSTENPFSCHLSTFSFPTMYGDIMPLFLMIALEWASQNNCCLSISSELALSGRDHFNRSDPNTLLIFLCSIRFTHCCHINFLNLLHEPSCLCWRTYSGSLWPDWWSPRITTWWLSHIIYSATDSHTLGSLSFFSLMPLSIVSNFAHAIIPVFSLSTDSIFMPSLKLSSNAVSLGQPYGLPHPNVTFAPLNSYCVYCHFLLFISVLISSCFAVSSFFCLFF